jgi:5-epi-alpha-selinene synthase
MPSLTRRDFVLTIGAAKHPAAPLIEGASTEIARSTGVLTDQNRARFAAFNALVPFVYPTAPLERAVACAVFCNLLFLYDDIHDEQIERCRDVGQVRRVMQGYLDVLRTGEVAGAPAPLDRYALYFRERALDLAGPAWLSRLLSSTEDYFFHGSIPAVERWVRGEVPGVQEFLVDREYDSAVHTALDLIELAEGMVLPEAFVASPPVRRLRRAAARTIACFNDIVSYGKEVPSLRNPNNLIHVLMVERRCSYDAALAGAVEIVNDYAREMLEHEPDVIAQGAAPAADARRYVEGMRRWQRGNIESSLESARYASRYAPFSQMRHSVRSSRARGPVSQAPVSRAPVSLSHP